MIAEWIKLRQFCTLRADLEGNGPDGPTTPGRRSERAKVRGWSRPSKQPPASVDPRRTRSRSHFKFLPIGSSIFDDCYRGINRCDLYRGTGSESKRARPKLPRYATSERADNEGDSAANSANNSPSGLRTHERRPLERTTLTRKSRPEKIAIAGSTEASCARRYSRRRVSIR